MILELGAGAAVLKGGCQRPGGQTAGVHRSEGMVNMVAQRRGLGMGALGGPRPRQQAGMYDIPVLWPGGPVGG